jgi:hypothetical protein
MIYGSYAMTVVSDQLMPHLGRAKTGFCRFGKYIPTAVGFPMNPEPWLRSRQTVF